MTSNINAICLLIVLKQKIFLTRIGFEDSRIYILKNQKGNDYVHYSCVIWLSFFFKPILAYTFLSLNPSILPQQETFATSVSVFR